MPMLAGIAGGIVVLIVAIIIALVKCRRQVTSEDLNELSGVDLLPTEETVGFDPEDTSYFVTETNVLTAENEDEFEADLVSDGNDDIF
jgi:hypothetical protein